MNKIARIMANCSSSMSLSLAVRQQAQLVIESGEFMREVSPLDELTLFCFPCAGGSATASFGHWRSYTEGTFRIVPLELPGRGPRLSEMALSDLNSIVDDLEAKIRPTGPYALLGHSFGALLAFECAHRLRERGLRSPLALVAIASSPPHVQDLERFRKTWPDEDVNAEICRIGSRTWSQLADEELRRMIIAWTASDFAALGSYSPASPPRKLDCRVLALGGDADGITPEELASWQDVTSGEVRVRQFAGDHFFLHCNPMAVLAEVRTACDAGRGVSTGEQMRWAS